MFRYTSPPCQRAVNFPPACGTKKIVKPRKSKATSAEAHAFAYGGRSRRILQCEDVDIIRLAEKFGTPLYVYSAEAIRARYRAIDAAFSGVPHTICFSVKANFNLSILKLLAKLGAGFDIVSGGELQRVLKAERKAVRRTVFSGVGKTAPEIDAALRAGILLFNVESESELLMLSARAAALKKRARLGLRVNPDVAAETHAYISTGLHEHKFGVPIDAARELYNRARRDPWLEVSSVSAHIGSQILDVTPFTEAVGRMAELAQELCAAGLPIRYLDAGGGLGIHYHHRADGQKPFAERAAAYADAITSPLRGMDLHILSEPGRSIIGPAGALITRVVYRKRNNSKRFVVVDAAMTDLIRPSLYGAYHEIVPVVSAAGEPTSPCDVVGPVCESGDFFARDRNLPAVKEGDLLAVLDAGAYGMSLASNYNSRCRAAEVLVDGKRARLIRRRETVRDLWRCEEV
jgi:diaminopimelate decarboxylase